MQTARQAKIHELRLRREKCRREAERSLAGFVRQAWKIVEPGRPYIDGWHIDTVCEHLQAVTERQIRNLLMNLPPRHTKSLLTNVFWPAWVWGPRKMPSEEWIFGSYSPKLSIRDAVKCRRILESGWYQSIWADVFLGNDRDRREEYERTGSLLAEDQNEKGNYRNLHSGARVATSVGGAGTGLGCDVFVFDDPHKVGRAESQVDRDRAINWIENEMSTRGNDPNTFARVGIMQRVHDLDATGYLLENQPGQWDHLLLAFEYDPKIILDMKPKTALGFQDPRKVEDERLWTRFNGEPGDRLIQSLKPYQRSGQLQQRPSAKEGEIFKRPWFEKRWHDLPPWFDYFLTTWDLTFGTGENEKKSDHAQGAYDVGYALGWYQGKYYVVDEVRKRLQPHEQEDETVKLKEKWAKWCRGILIEDAANGKATAKKIKRNVAGVMLVSPQGSKTERAQANSDPFEAGDVLFPADSVRPWAADAVEEFINFSERAKFKDRVDALIQGIAHLEAKVSIRRRAALAVPTSVEKASIWAEA